MSLMFHYYNHSLLPNTLDCENADFSRDDIKRAFRENKKALFLTYTNNFDCGFDTGWYYVINDSGLSYLENISSKHRKNLNRINKKVYCKIISPKIYKEEIKKIGLENIKRYKNYGGNTPSFEYDENQTLVGAFSALTNELVGFEVIRINKNQTALISEKHNQLGEKIGSSYALVYFVLSNMCNFKDGGYVTNGSRTVSHITNHNDFLIQHCGFRKAYCRLHIVFRPRIKILFLIIRPFWFIFKLFDKIHIIHLLNAVLFMDRISRKQNKMFKKRDD